MNLVKTQFTSLAQKALVLLAVLVISACASNKSQDSDAAQTVEEPTVVTTPIGQAGQASTNTMSAAGDLVNVFYFDFDKSTLTASARAALDAQAAYLRGNNVSVRLEGHADERGSREYNLALGERRAKAVADYLAIQGVSRSRMEVVSYGEERPVSLGSDESSWSANRRVELK